MYRHADASVHDAAALTEYVLLRAGASVKGPRLAFQTLRLRVCGTPALRSHVSARLDALTKVATFSVDIV